MVDGKNRSIYIIKLKDANVCVDVRQHIYVGFKFIMGHHNTYLRGVYVLMYTPGDSPLVLHLSLHTSCKKMSRLEMSTSYMSNTDPIIKPHKALSNLAMNCDETAPPNNNFQSQVSPPPPPSTTESRTQTCITLSLT